MLALEFVKPGEGDGRVPNPDLVKRVQAEALARKLIVLTAGTYVNVDPDHPAAGDDRGRSRPRACGRSTRPSPPPAPEVGDAVNRLPDGTRRRLQGFAGRLERIRIEDLPMYVVRPIEPGHGEAVERAETAAEKSGLGGAVDEARSAMIEFVERQFTGPPSTDPPSAA